MKKTWLRALAAFLAAGLILPFSAFGAEETERAVSFTSGDGTALSDFSGEGTVIAVIAAGFDVTHPAFSAKPDSPSLTEKQVTARLGGEYAHCWLSEKLPFVCDYVGLGLPPTPDAEFIGTLPEGIDTDVAGLADDGTPLASLAAGCYRGAGDIVQDDGTVRRDSDYFGAAPEAQLLFMKAASDLKSALVPEAVTQAVLDAVTLRADVILLDLSRVEITDEVTAALSCAEDAGIPVVTGAGDMNESVQQAMKNLPAAVTERGSLLDTASLPAVVSVGAAADPLSGVSHVLLGGEELPYLDSSADYLNRSFAAHFPGQTLPVAIVSGYGRAEDYEGMDAAGKIAVVLRGEIPFAEKAKCAADAGAVGLIVVNTAQGTERMALTDTKIPAVMISSSEGERLLQSELCEITVPGAVYRAADFSARGLTGALDAAVSFLTLGENLTAAVKGGGYASRTGSLFAAARAAGYLACTAQYIAQSELSLQAASLLAAAARPVTEGEDASPRTVGAGIVDEDCRFPAVCMSADGATVSVPKAGDYINFSVPLSVTNSSDESRTLTLTAAFFSDAVNAEGILTGAYVPAPHMYAYADSCVNLTAEGEVLTLSPGETEKITLRVSVSPKALYVLGKNAPFGFYIDGILTLTDTEGTVAATHALSFFKGDPAAAPIADVTVYDGATPCLAASELTVLSVSDGFAMPIGARDPFAAAGEYDEAFNLVNPKSLRDGAAGGLQLKLTVLREISSATVRFFDAEGRLLFEEEKGALSRYLVTGGRASLPLWDFTAPDEPDYVFPDGVYRCEVVLTAAGGAEQTLHFTLTADSRRPSVTDVTFTDDTEGNLYMTVRAADNAALRDISVYDMLRQYPAAEETACAGEKSVTVTYNITAYDGESPLYVEVTDYAGSYLVRRFTLTDIARYMEGESAP